MRFWPNALDGLPKNGSGWTRSGRMLLFEIDLSASEVRLKAILGPGSQEIRERLHQWIKAHPGAFNRALSRLYPQWWSFHSQVWLNKVRFESLDLEELKSQIGDRVRTFLETELPAMQHALEECPGLSLGAQGTT